MRRALLVIALAAGCAPTEQQVAVRACRDVAHAFASRCPDGDAEEEALELGCDSAVSVRDLDALVDACIPAIRALPCGQEGPLPDACVDQLRTE